MDRSLVNFQLGISPDGTRCVMMFPGEDQRMTTCSTDFLEFNRFVASLCQAAGEMARRRAACVGEEPADSPVPINVASVAFALCPGDGYVWGALEGDAGEMVGLRMCPDVAGQMTRAMLLALPATGTS